ncbi:hypothetical protein HMI56_007404 [Coelomomyces lativittatus]|nr:hypothetical protein HMI56_007404 [Coelomomyces lativittatus]
MQWMAITFLLNHVSAFTVAMGMGVRDLVFLMVYWQLQGLHLRWFGYIGFICVGVSAYFCTQLLKKIQEQQHRYTALQNPI